MLIVLAGVILGWGKSNNIDSVESGYNYFKAWSDKAWDCGAGEAEWNCTVDSNGKNNSSDGKNNGSNDSKLPTKEELKKIKDEALTKLEKVQIGEENSINYNRSEWKHWTGSPCDTRETVLKNQGKDVKADSKTCKALSGVWLDPYSNETFTEASKLDIDHIIALSYAARHGGQDWDAKKKEQFANDKTQLLAVSASENRKKSDKGPADYMPPNKAFHCEYSKKWLATASKYGVSITEKDKRALKSGLQKC